MLPKSVEPIGQPTPYLPLPYEPPPPAIDIVATLKPPRHRGAVACRRCRRLRNKCLNSAARSPCQGCVAAGPDVAAECYFPSRGERDVDRYFRRRPPRAQQSKDEQPSSPPAGPKPETVTGPPSTGRQLEIVSGGSISSMASMPSSLSQHENVSSPKRLPSPTASKPQLWPPHSEVVDGCRTFVACYFQLGFLPKALFLEQLVQAPSHTSRFMLSCILSISSRFTPALVRRYGSRTAATDYFLGLAQAQAMAEMYSPSLERTQAFFLLSIAEWGNSDRERSAIDMAVAARMAILLHLHREETYRLPRNSSSAGSPSVFGADCMAISPCGTYTGIPADQVVRLESARRTFWMIYSQENLHAGTSTPAPLALEDTTAFLPCNEADFAFGIVPNVRAALAETPPARENPELAVLPSRCLFATLIQAHCLWGRVARHSTRESLGNGLPWSPGNAFTVITQTLSEWETTLPPRHRWSVWNLRGWRSEGLHLAYLSVVMVLRLSNIVIRRVYLNKLIDALSPRDSNGLNVTHHKNGGPAAFPGTIDNSGSQTDGAANDKDREYWQHMSHELFDNVVQLHEQVVAYFNIRTTDEGFPAILVFCIYMCGSLASYLWHNPHLCPHISSLEAEEMVLSTLRILGELYTAWPASARWKEVLQRISGTAQLQHVHSSQEQEQQVSMTSTTVDLNLCKDDNALTRTDDTFLPSKSIGGACLPSADPSLENNSAVRPNIAHNGFHSDNLPKNPDFTGAIFGMDNDNRNLVAAFPYDLFNAELTDYLDGNIHYGLLDGFP